MKRFSPGHLPLGREPSRKRDDLGSSRDFLEHFDDAAIAVDFDPIARFDHGQRILIQIGHRGTRSDHGA